MALSGQQSLAELEVLCKQLYEGTDLAQRIQAEKVLLELINSPECLSQCQLLLEQGTTSYAQLLAATCLSKLVCKTTPLPVQQRMDIRNYILNYVASRPKLALFVIQALVQVIAKITKLGWFDVQKDQLVFRDIIADVKKFLQGTVDHCIIGVMILSELTQEMNFVDYSRPSSKHRKIATSFRDTILKDILMLACSLLKEMLAKPLNLQDQQQQSLAMHLLKLVLNCLNFDFIGSSADESADDLCTVQIPTNWRSIFLEPETLDLFFDLYHSLPSVLSQLALSCLVQFASTRRSLFSNPERAKYLGNLIKGVKGILENPQGLSDPGNYHEFCRFLARLKTNYQLGELVVVKDYPEVIRLIASFTITSLQHWEFAPNSVHYLLTLWQRMVASVPFVKSSEPHLLDTYAPEITKAYITSRLESVPMVIRDGLDDPLDDTATVFQQLEQLCTVSRCEYEKTCALLVQLFDQNAQNYQKLLQPSSRNPMALSIQEGRLAWLVYLVGTVVGGRLTYTSTDEHDAMDGELSCRVFQLISLMDAQLPRSSNEKVELAILWFLDQFRKTYVGDQLQRTSKVYARMSDVLGITDDNQVLETFMAKISQRLNFDVSSPNGILLFREASKMICTYGNQILSLGTLSKDQVYPLKLKGISICYSALKSALCGNYVSFGVFKLYGDNHFDNVLQAFVKMLLSVTHSDLLQYRKLSQSYYPLLECLTQDHMCFITSLEPRVLMYIFTSVSEGLTALDTIVSSSCCASLDYIVTYLFKHIAKEGKKPHRCREISQDGQRLLLFMQQNSEVLQQMMSILMNTIIFEDCKNQWSVSRPLLGLILLNEKYFSELRASLINSQPADKQEVLQQCFRNLMDGIEQNLLVKNRDRFTQNVSVFRRDIAETLRCEGASELSSLEMMS
ncbi:ran-binding protein 17 isoform X3 [Sphaerodactylus townsendi]|uniref:ran-binding protein 17 isoform X3 n=1 Tax=Sphaerodactylus townsendi TaxID=933632 RepID=UPI0020272BCF|nr:ran-binding protein 17 isoform X3 [Sphaerodactylus townsendi]